jgi:hypothetical protein
MSTNHYKLTVNPDQVDTAGNGLITLGEHLRTRADAIKKTPGEIPDHAWSGKARTAIEQEITGLGNQAARFAPLFHNAGQKLKDAAAKARTALDDVAKLNVRWDEAQTTYDKAVKTAHSTYETSASNLDPAIVGSARTASLQGLGSIRDKAVTDAGATLANVQKGFDREFNGIFGEVELAFTTAGKTLADSTIVAVSDDTVHTFTDHHMTGLSPGFCTKDGNFPPDLHADRAIDGDMPLTHQLTGQTDAAAAKPLVEAAAKGDKAALAKLKAEYGDQWKDAYFSYFLTKELGAKGFSDISGQLLTQLAKAKNGEDGGKAQAADNKWLMAFLGSGLATTSNPANDGKFDPVFKDQVDSYRTNTLFPELKADGRAKHSSPEYGAQYYGYWSLGNYLEAASSVNHVSFGRPFMDNVGGDLVAWDQEMGKDKTRDYSFAGPQMGFGGGMRIDSLISVEGGTNSADPVNALLDAAKVDKDSARGLLMHDLGGGKKVVDYLTADRFNTFDNGVGFNDKGNALGDAVLIGDHDRTNQEATELASRFVNDYGKTLGANRPLAADDHDNNAGGQSPYGFVMADMRDSVGSIMAYYIPDVDHALTTNDAASDSLTHLNGDKTFGINFGERKELSSIFADLANDRPGDVHAGQPTDNPPALQRVIDAQLLYGSQRVHDTIAAHGADPNAIGVVAGQNGQAMNYIVQSGNLGLQTDADHKDAYNAYLAGMVKQGAGLVPVDKIPVVGKVSVPGIGNVADYAWDKATDYLIENQLPQDAGAQQAAANSEFTENINRLTLGQIQSQVAGTVTTWPAGHDPATWLSHQAAYQHDPKYNFVDATGHILPEARMTPEQRSAYHQWRDDTNTGAGDIFGNADNEYHQSGQVGVTDANTDYK